MHCNVSKQGCKLSVTCGPISLQHFCLANETQKESFWATLLFDIHPLDIIDFKSQIWLSTTICPITIQILVTTTSLDSSEFSHSIHSCQLYCGMKVAVLAWVQGWAVLLMKAKPQPIGNRNNCSYLNEENQL